MASMFSQTSCTALNAGDDSMLVIMYICLSQYRDVEQNKDPHVDDKTVSSPSYL